MTDKVEEWSTNKAYISASSIHTIGRWTGTQDSLLGLEYDGNLLRLKFQDDNEVLFYMKEPQTNETYNYKLTNSSITSSLKIKTNSSQEEESDNWYFWNQNAIVDSKIVIPHGYDGFTCDYVELPYYSLQENFKEAIYFEEAIPEAKIEIHDFTVGFLTKDSRSRNLYNPCGSGRGKCLVIDGKVECGNVLYWQYGALGVGLVMLACFLYCLFAQCLRSRNLALYERVYRDNDDEIQSLRSELEMTGWEYDDDDMDAEDLDETASTSKREEFQDEPSYHDKINPFVI
mmetsp:Transcript_17528/g.25938  ORF Transcript_17528/g.25938 Transcript_17528/m.25938 type:complete len:287 (-) Transcript_17528:9-869(-)